MNDDARAADWVQLAGEVPSPGEIVPVEGHDLVIWAGADGLPCVMESRCPHQWSHLGAEGLVDGEEIVCTAHFWRFDRAGCGSKLTLEGRRDEKASIGVFECEVRGTDVWVRLPRRPGPAGPSALPDPGDAPYGGDCVG